MFNFIYEHKPITSGMTVGSKVIFRRHEFYVEPHLNKKESFKTVDEMLQVLNGLKKDEFAAVRYWLIKDVLFFLVNGEVYKSSLTFEPDVFIHISQSGSIDACEKIMKDLTLFKEIPDIGNRLDGMPGPSNTKKMLEKIIHAAALQKLKLSLNKKHSEIFDGCIKNGSFDSKKLLNQLLNNFAVLYKEDLELVKGYMDAYSQTIQSLTTLRPSFLQVVTMCSFSEINNIRVICSQLATMLIAAKSKLSANSCCNPNNSSL